MEYYKEWLSKNALIFRVTQILTMRQHEYKDGRIFGEHVASYGELLNWFVASWQCGVGWWNKLIFTSTLVEQTNIHLDSVWIFGERVASYGKLMSLHGGTMASGR